MSRRGKRAYWARQSESKTAEERWFNETLAKAPVMPHPLPGEIEEGWDIYRILEEIERLRPSIEAARKEWFERRRAEMPLEVKAWLAEAAKDRPTDRPTDRPNPADRSSRSQPTASLTPEERRARKLQQTRESNARKRAERKAAKLAAINEEGTLTPWLPSQPNN